jgi:hypothetical protein
MVSLKSGAGPRPRPRNRPRCGADAAGAGRDTVAAKMSMTVAGTARAQRRPEFIGPGAKNGSDHIKMALPGLAGLNWCHLFQNLPSVGQIRPVPSHSVQSPNIHWTDPSPLHTEHCSVGRKHRRHSASLSPHPMTSPSRSQPQAIAELSRTPAGRRVGPNTVEWTSTSAA